MSCTFCKTGISLVGIVLMICEERRGVTKGLPKLQTSSCTLTLQVVSSKDVTQLHKLAVSMVVASIPGPEPVGTGDAAVHWPLCKRLHRAVCTVTSKL